MSRLYRVRIEVAGRDGGVDERAAIWDVAAGLIAEPMDEQDHPRKGGEGRHLFAFEGEMNLNGGTSPDEAHAQIRSTLEGRAVSTKWWYLERDPDHEFDDAEDGE